MTLTDPPAWAGRSSDPNDVQFGDLVEPTTLDRVGEFDAVLVGEPYDGAVIGRRGAREAPGAIRAALAGLKTHQFDAGPVRAVGDLGDVAFRRDEGTGPTQHDGRTATEDEGPVEADSGGTTEDRSPRGGNVGVEGGVEAVHETVRAVASDVYSTATLPVFLGGDNSLTFPNAAPLLERGSLGCLNFDAHLDVREVREEPTSGTPYRQLLEAGVDAYACIGPRHFETTTAYHDFVRQRGGTVLTAEEVGDDTVAVVDRALDAMDTAGVDGVYVSLDVDVIDAAAAPGVSAPTPGGVSTRELFRMLRMTAADDRVAGFEVVECAPPLDRDGRTVRAAARAIAHFLSGFTAGGSA